MKYERINRRFSPMQSAISTGAPEPPSIILGELDGALKEFVDFSVASATSPQPLLSLGAAICAIGGAAGRRYRSATNLRTNFMVAAVCASAGGKETPRRLISSLLTAAGLELYNGGARIPSGAGLITALRDHPVCVLSIDEIGHMFLRNSGKQANSHQQEITPLMTEMFSRASGEFGGVLYADSKLAPRTPIVNPHLCVFGATVPSVLWKAFQEGNMIDGSLARWLVLASPLNYPEPVFEPECGPFPSTLVDTVRMIAADAGGGNLSGVLPMSSAVAVESIKIVPYSAEARDRLRRLQMEEHRLKQVNEKDDAATAVIGRRLEHTIKLAMVKAIGRDPQAPVITLNDTEWAAGLVAFCTDFLLDAGRDHIADTPFQANLNKARVLIRSAGGQPVSLSDLTRKLQRIGGRDRSEIVETLKEMGEIREMLATGPKGGPTKIYIWTGE